MKELHGASHSPSARRRAAWVARHYGAATRMARTGLRLASWTRALPGGAAVLEAASGLAHRLAPAVAPRLDRRIPLPRPARPLPRLRDGNGAAGGGVVYFASCLTRTIGLTPAEDAVPPGRAAVAVLQAAGLAVRYPPGLDALCCGMPFSSKSYPEAAEAAAARTAEALWAASESGRVPVVTDASPCAGTLKDLVATRLRDSGRDVELFDFPVFWAERVLPRLPAQKKVPRAVLHPTCSLLKMGALPHLLACARAHAEEVLVPANAECCGFAGDRGFQVPELTASAAAREAEEVRAMTGADTAALVSTCRTCEIGMGRAVGRPYTSLVHLIHSTVVEATAR
jgi:D-lactate dehydrogenase